MLWLHNGTVFGLPYPSEPPHPTPTPPPASPHPTNDLAAGLSHNRHTPAEGISTVSVWFCANGGVCILRVQGFPVRPGAVRGGPCQGGRVFRPTQHRLRHLHRLLHQLPTVMWPVVVLVCGGVGLWWCWSVVVLVCGGVGLWWRCCCHRVDYADIVTRTHKRTHACTHARTHADKVHARGVAIFLCC